MGCDTFTSILEIYWRVSVNFLVIPEDIKHSGNLKLGRPSSDSCIYKVEIEKEI